MIEIELMSPEERGVFQQINERRAEYMPHIEKGMMGYPYIDGKLLQISPTLERGGIPIKGIFQHPEKDDVVVCHPEYFGYACLMGVKHDRIEWEVRSPNNEKFEYVKIDDDSITESVKTAMEKHND